MTKILSPAEIQAQEKKREDERQAEIKRKLYPVRKDANPAKVIDMEPIPAETINPHPQETTVAEAEDIAEETKQEGAQFPITHYRPTPPESKREEGSVIVAKELAGQLGTAPHIKAQQRIDERKLAVLTDATLIALSHFSFRYVYDGVRYFGHITEWYLTGSQGIGGLGRRHILQAISNSSGVQSVEKAEKPNVVARNVWDRSWRKKAEREGKVVEE